MEGAAPTTITSPASSNPNSNPISTNISTEPTIALPVADEPPKAVVSQAETSAVAIKDEKVAKSEMISGTLPEEKRPEKENNYPIHTMDDKKADEKSGAIEISPTEPSVMICRDGVCLPLGGDLQILQALGGNVAVGKTVELSVIKERLNAALSAVRALERPSLKREQIPCSDSHVSLNEAVTSTTKTIVSERLSSNEMQRLNRFVEDHVKKSITDNTTSNKLCYEAERQLYWPLIQVCQKISQHSVKSKLHDIIFPTPRTEEKEKEEMNFGEQVRLLHEARMAKEAEQELASAVRSEYEQESNSLLYNWFVQKLVQDDETMSILYQIMKSMSQAEKTQTQTQHTQHQTTQTGMDSQNEKDDHDFETKFPQILPSMNALAKSPPPSPKHRNETQSIEMKNIPRAHPVVSPTEMDDDECETDEQNQNVTQASELLVKLQLSEQTNRRLEEQLRHSKILYSQMKEQFKTREAHWQKVRKEHENESRVAEENRLALQRKLQLELKNTRKQIHHTKRKLKHTNKTNNNKTTEDDSS
jgi:hypothetical protein